MIFIVVRICFIDVHLVIFMNICYSFFLQALGSHGWIALPPPGGGLLSGAVYTVECVIV